MSERNLAQTLFYSCCDPEAKIRFLVDIALELRREGAHVVAFGDIVFQWPDLDKEESKGMER